MFVQLNPPIPLYVIDRGTGFALGVIDYGQEHNLIWVTAIDATGEIWCAPNPMVRMQKNWTLGRAAAIGAGAPPDADAQTPQSTPEHTARENDHG